MGKATIDHQRIAYACLRTAAGYLEQHRATTSPRPIAEVRQCWSTPNGRWLTVPANDGDQVCARTGERLALNMVCITCDCDAFARLSDDQIRDAVEMFRGGRQVAAMRGRP